MQITNNFGEGVTSMMANGMPLSALLPANVSIDSSRMILPYTYSVGTLSVTAHATEQERLLNALFAGVSSGLYVFSSIGGDRMALAAAAMLFAHYLNEYKAASASRDADPSLRSPVWVQASAGFKTIDKIQREQENNKRDPTLVVISNIVSSSSQNRKETVRDMLCLYDGSPRLVVTAPMSPMQIQSDLAIDVDGGIMFQSYQSRR